MTDVDPKDLLSQLRKDLEELQTFPGLGRSPDHHVLGTIAPSLVQGGTRAAYIDEQPLEWFDKKHLLSRALSDLVRDAGFDIEARLAVPSKAVQQVKDRAWLRETDEERWSSIAHKPRYTATEPPSFLQDDVRFIDLGEDWGEVRGALMALQQGHASLSRLCLETGRVLAVDMTSAHPFFVSPETWRTDPRRRLDGCHFLITCRLPASLFADRKGGQVTTAEIDAEREAIRFLERAHNHPEFRDKFLTKAVAGDVLCAELGISKAGVDRRVWSSAKIKRWKTAGHRPERLKISAPEFRKFISDNQSPQVGD